MREIKRKIVKKWKIKEMEDKRHAVAKRPFCLSHW
jgi:hypothetical protein